MENVNGIINSGGNSILLRQNSIQASASSDLTLENVVELRRVGKLWQEKAFLPDGVSNDGNSSALELLVPRVPGFNNTCFTLNAVIRF